MKHPYSLKLTVLAFYLFFTISTYSQVTCSDETPYFVADLSGSPDSLYLSPSESRDGSCCGSLFPDRCIEFTVILNNAAIGLEFDIFSGAEPPGALFYQIDCGQTVMVGEQICLQGGEEYTLTFCKPGANQNVYSIQSIPAPISTDTVTTRINCTAAIHVEGPIDSTVVWNDVTSNDGRYNDYLACVMGCDSTTVTPDEDAPSLIKYEVCGIFIPSTCQTLPLTICDTVVVNILPEVQVGLEPGPLYVCEDNPQPIEATINLPQENILFNWYDSTGIADGGLPIATGMSFTPTITGTYWIVATDTTFAQCNMDTANVDIVIQPLPVFNPPQSTIICTGDSETFVLDDEITYTWSPNSSVTQIPGTSTFEVSPSITTDYMVTAEDSVGCIFSETINVEVIPEFGVALSFTEILYCEDDIQPIEAQFTGVGGDVVYEWFNANTNQSIFTGQSYLPTQSGIYYVVATNNDLQACNVDTATIEVTIQPLPVFSIPAGLTLCEGNSEIFELQEGYTYNWVPSTAVTLINGQNTFQVGPLQTTTYTITSQDSEGCTFTDEITIEVIPAFGVVVSPDQYLFCEDAVENIQAELTGIGGDVTFSWYNEANNQFLLSDQQFLPSATGSYYVVATHNEFQACNLDTAFVSVTIQPLPEFTLPASLTLCEGESEIFELEEGFSYTWMPPTAVSSIDGQHTFQVAPTQTTTYTVISEDAFGCTFTAEVMVEVIPAFGVTVSPDQYLFCEDAFENIQAELTGIGGDVTFSWYNEANNQFLFSGQEFLPPATGSYYVVATHNEFQACNLDTAFVSVTIQPLPEFTIPANLSLCEGDSETLELVEGFSYTWTPATGIIPVDGQHTFRIAPTQTTTYTVSSEDAVGCTFTTEITVEVIPAFGVTISPDQYLFCADNVQTVQAQLTGIGGNISFSWYDGANDQFLFTGQQFLPPATGSYYVVAIHNEFQACNLDTATVDVNIQPLPEFTLPTSLTLCEGDHEIFELQDGFSYSWSPSAAVTSVDGQHTFRVEPTQTTTYTVTSENLFGCTYASDITIEVIPEFGVTANPSQYFFCEDNVQPIQAQLTGIDGNVIFQWYNSNTNQLLFTGQTFLPLASGTYYVVATNNDFQACNIDTATVEVTIQPLPEFSTPSNLTICEGDVEILELQDGYSYTWSPAFSATPILGTNFVELHPTETTTFTVTSQDNFGCTFSRQIVVEVIPAFGVTVSPAQYLFCENNVQAIQAQLTGVGGNVNYSWYNAISNQFLFTGQNFLPTTSGSFYVVATNNDLESCNIDSAFVDVTIQPLPEFSLPPSITLCEGENQVFELPDGFSYIWSPASSVNPIIGTNSFEVQPIETTTYTVTAQDFVGCTFSDQITVEVIPEFGVSVFPSQWLFCEDNVQPIQAQLIGQSNNVTYRWYNTNSNQFLFTGQTFLPPSTGNYHVVATNNNFQICNIDTAFISVTIQPAPAFNIPSSTTICEGEIEIFELEDGFSYSWSPPSSVTPILGTNAFEVEPIQTTTYTVTATDNVGCTFTDQVTVNVIPEFGVALNEPQIVYCEGNIQPIEAQLIGVDGNVTFHWYNTQTSQLVFTGQSYLPIASGTYSVVATNFDLPTCNIDTATVEVTIQPLPEFNLPSSATLCGGETIQFELPEGPVYTWSPSGGVTTVTGNNVFEVSPTSDVNYTVTAEDVVGCTFSDQINVEVIPEFGVIVDQPQILYCEDNIQPINAQLTGVGGNVTFRWYNTSSNQLVFTGQTFLPPTSGTFSVVATNFDLPSCNIDTAMVEVTIQALPEFILPGTASICGGETVQFELPEGPVYTWSPSAGVTQGANNYTFNVSPVSNTTYTVMAQDEVGCSFTDQIEVEVVPEFVVNIEPEMLFCGDEIEPIQPQLIGASGSVSYRWYNATSNQLVFTGPEFTPSISGDYYVVATLTDFQSCNRDTASTSITIESAPEFSIPGLASLCNGESTLVELPIGPFYTWAPLTDVNQIVGTNIYELNPSTTTTYTVTALNEAGCSVTEEITVEVVPDFGVILSQPTYVYCENELEPIQAQLIGVGGNVTFQWYDANNSQLLSTGQNFLPANSGNYYVVATNNDLQSCNLDTATAEVTIHPIPEFDLETSVDLCGGESIMIELPTGLNYSWTPLTGVSLIQGTNVFEVGPNQSTSYTVTAQNFTGCSSSHQIDVNVGPEFGVEIAPSQILFCEDNVQPIQAQLSGAGNDVVFRWYNSTNNQLVFVGQSYLPSVSGSYHVVASTSDFQVCNVDTALVEVNIQPAPTFDISNTIALCQGESTIVELPEGPNYFWLPLTGVTLISGTNVFAVNPSQSTTYTVTAQNNVGCTHTEQIPVEVTPEYNVTISPDPVVFCENDIQALEATLIGEGSGFTYLWYDSIGLANGNQPLGSGQSFTPSFPGTYAVVAFNEDFTACNSDTALVNVEFEPLPQFDMPELPDLCTNNPMTIELPIEFTYTWVPAEGVTQIPGTSQFLISPQANTVYTVVAENIYGCTSIDQLAVDVILSPLADAGPPATFDCNNDFVILQGNIVNNGPNVSFNWTGPNGGIQEGADGLSPTVILPGWYYLITNNDQNGCSTIDSVQVSSNFEAPVAELPETLSMDCETLEVLVDGSASSTGMNYEYDWASLNAEPINEDGTPFLVVNRPGFYTLTVTNLQNGCEAMDVVEIISPPLLEGVALTADAICSGDENGFIEVDTVIGGTSPFRFSFNGSPFVNVTYFPELDVGVYTLGIQDANGCEWWENVIIEEESPIEIDLGADLEIADGEIVELSFETNLQNFLIDSIHWSPEAFVSCVNCRSTIAAPNISTTFQVEITDIFGCSATDEVKVDLVEKEIVYIPTGFSPNGDNNNDRFVIFTRPGVAEIEVLQIFDRWGNMVFETKNAPPNDPQFGWDGNFEGRPMNTAVFVFFTKLRLMNGSTIVRKGDITLFR